MRIGDLNFTDIDADVHSLRKRLERTIVSRSLPGFISDAHHDIRSRRMEVEMEMVLHGSSKADLSTKIDGLTTLYARNEVLWLDLSDEWRNALWLGKIIGLDGLGFEGAKPTQSLARLMFKPLLPWGTIHVNSGDAEIADLDYRFLEEHLNPLEVNAGFTLDTLNTKWTQEVILVSRLSAQGWAHFEIQVPDNLEWVNAEGMRLYAWNPAASAYDANPFLHVDGTPQLNADCGYMWFLDGTSMKTLKGAALDTDPDGIAGYAQNDRGATQSPSAATDTLAGDIIYSYTYGMVKRLGFALTMPADTGQPDLSGGGAANKAKVKVEVYYDREDTSYVGV